MVLYAHPSSHPNGILIGSDILAQLMVMSNGQTHTEKDTDCGTPATIGRISALCACDNHFMAFT